MPHPRRPRPRHRRPAFELQHDDHACSVWLPDPDDPFVLDDFGDAASLACTLVEWYLQREALILMDERRAVTAILIDPCPEVALAIGCCDGPGLEVPFCSTLGIGIVPEIPDRPPTTAEVQGYRALRRIHMHQGLRLLDLVLVDPAGDKVRSMAIAVDPDNDWFQPVDAGEWRDTDDRVEPAA